MPYKIRISSSHISTLCFFLNKTASIASIITLIRIKYIFPYSIGNDVGYSIFIKQVPCETDPLTPPPARTTTTPRSTTTSTMMTSEMSMSSPPPPTPSTICTTTTENRR